MFGNQIRFTGMVSGMDTHTIVQQLMRAESMRMDRLTRRRQLATWRQEEMRSIASNMRTFHDTHLSMAGAPNNVMRSTTFQALDTTVMHNGQPHSGITVTAGANAQAGQFNVVVSQLAAAQRFQGVNINANRSDAPGAAPYEARITLATRMDSVAMNRGTAATRIFTPPDEPRTIVAGSSQHIPRYIPGTTPPEPNPAIGNHAAFFQPHAGWIPAIRDDGTLITTIERQSATLVGADIQGYFTTTLPDYVQVERFTIEGTSGEPDEVQYFVRISNPPGTTPLYNFYAVNRAVDGTLSLSRPGGVNEVLDNVPLAMQLIAPPASRAYNYVHTLQFQSAIYFDNPDPLGTEPIRVNVNSNDTVGSVIRRINESGAGVIANFDTVNGVFTLTSTEVGRDGDRVTPSDPSGFLQVMFGMPLTGAGSVTPTPGEDALVTANGIELIALNDRQDTFSFNGHTITMAGVQIPDDPPNGTVTFSVTSHRNIEATVTAIREFVDAYNEMILMLHNAHRTPRPRSSSGGRRSFFEPLTDAERREMSDRDIERWEQNARTGLLHRDSTLRAIQNNLRRNITAGVRIGPNRVSNTDRIYLHQIGITADGSIPGQRNTNHIGLLTIDEDRLRAAIQLDPEAVGALFTTAPEMLTTDQLRGLSAAERATRQENTGLGNRLINSINDATRVGGAGSLTRLAGDDIYSQDRFSRQIQTYDRRIDRMQEWLVRRENQLFRQFSLMEQAMSRSHAQMDSLFMFGMN